MNPMTPGEFLAKMKQFADGGDTEINHARADDLLCEVLVSLGYSEGIRLFEDMDKWYA